jgi:hypothetical protein
MPQNDHPEKRQTKRIMALALASFLISAPWLWFSGRFALNSAGDCDVWRQWTVSQYVHHGINPYKISLDILKLNYGEMRGPDRLRLGDFKIYEVHPKMKRDGIPNVLEEFGPPTSTYPPSSLLPIAYTVGFLPRHSVHMVWLLVCLAALCLAWRHLVRHYSICLLYTSDAADEGLGVFFALALIKPSVALPFLIIPLVKRKWITLAIAGLLHGIAWCIMSVLVKASPLELLAQWTEIPRYFLLGAYSIQEFTNRLGLDNTTTGTVIMLGFVGLCALWCWMHRRAESVWHLAFLSFVSVLWTYHERYDFFVLLLPLALCLRNARSAPLLTLAGFALLGLALTDPVYGTDHPASHVLRWTGRLALYALTVRFAFALRTAARRG